MELIGLLSQSNQTPYLPDYDSIAIITPDTALSYKQLNNKISFSVEALVNLGINRGDKAAILGENSAEYVILILALWKLGAIPVPLNIRLLKNEIKELILFAECKLLLTGKTDKDIDNIPGVKLARFPIDEPDTIKQSENIQSGQPDKLIMSNTAVTIFTSGSTGKPKGVVLTFNNLLQSVHNGNKLFNHKPGDRWLASLPFYHIGGFSVIARNFIYGSTLIVPSSLKTEDLVSALNNLNPTLTSLVSTQLQRIMEAGCKPNLELRHVLLGGGFIETSLVNEALKRGWNVTKSYGSTETASFVTVLTAEEFKLKPQSAGKAILPNEIFIVDENKNILPCNKSGEIAIRAESVADGYLNNEEETKRKFSGRTFYSGDYGLLDEDGYLFIEARREDLIISGGENINPFEIEAEIMKYRGVNEVCVFGIKDKEWGDIIAAAIVSETDISIEHLREFLKDKLPPFKHPKRIFKLDELPKTELGKIMRGEIKERLKDSKI